MEKKSIGLIIIFIAFCSCVKMLGYEKKHILLENTKAAKLVSEQYLDQYGINYCVLFVEGQRMFRDSIYNTATDTRDDFTIANRTGFVIANSGDTLYYKDLFSCPGGANNLFFECKQDSNYLSNLAPIDTTTVVHLLARLEKYNGEKLLFDSIKEYDYYVFMKWASFAKGPFKRRIKKVKELFKEEDKVLFIFENQDLRLDMKMPDSVRTALKEKFDNGYRGYF